MASSGSTKSRKSSRRKADSAVKKKSSRSRTASRKTGGSQKESIFSRVTLLPLISIWLLAVITLASLIYWGWKPRSNDLRPKTTVTESRETVNNGARRQTPRPPNKPKRASVPSSPPSKPTVVAGVDGSSPARRPLPTPPPAPEPVPVAKVAIVIDDFGMDLKVANEFLSLPIPITFSVIPYLRHSREVADLIRRHGHEVMLHMPMQPQGYPQKDPGQGALMITMGPRQIRETLDMALSVSPYAKGINNHMGSRFTEDPAGMKIVLEELKKRHLFFLDSFTTAHSVGFRLARSMGVPTARRDIFLDHKPSAAFITHQLHKLIEKAKIRGSAVAIGHPYKVTLETLRKNIGLFAEERVKVVGLSELVR